MSPFAASNFDSPLAATEEAVNATLAPFAPIPEAVQLQLGNVSTTDGDCSSYCQPNEFSQRRRCLSCEVQMDQPSTSREGPAIKVETEAHITGHSCLLLFDIPMVSRYDI